MSEEKSQGTYRKFNRVPDYIREQVSKLYLQGESSPSIAKKFQISSFCVRKILKESGIQIRDNWKFKSLETEIVAEYSVSDSAAVVAKKYNTSNVVILKILRRNNVAIKSSVKGEKHPHWKGGKVRKAHRMLLYVKNRYKNDPLFRLEQNCRNRIRSFLKTVNIRKNKQTADLLGAEWNAVRGYIEAQFQDGMTWENHGNAGWVIDHRIPLASAKTEVELITLFHYKNLQPLWAAENLAKSSFYEGIYYRKNGRVS